MKTHRDCKCFHAIRQIWDTHERHVEYEGTRTGDGSVPCCDNGDMDERHECKKLDPPRSGFEIKPIYFQSTKKKYTLNEAFENQAEIGNKLNEIIKLLNK